MTSSNVLDDLLVFGTQEDNNWVKLGVVEPIHRIWGDVEQAVFASLHHFPNCGQPDDTRRLAPLFTVCSLCLCWYEKS
jgi:hypothetical protein